VVFDEVVELGVCIACSLEQVVLFGVWITLLSPGDPEAVELGVDTAGYELEDEALDPVPEPGGFSGLG